MLPFLDGGAAALPGLVGLGDDAYGTNSHKVGPELTNTGRLVRYASLARVNKIVAEVVSAKDSTIDTPVIGQLSTIGPAIPGGSTT